MYSHAGQALGAAAPDLWKAPIEQLLANPELQSQIPAARLYALAATELVKPDVRSQMSIFGNLSTDVVVSAPSLIESNVLCKTTEVKIRAGNGEYFCQAR